MGKPFPEITQKKNGARNADDCKKRDPVPCGRMRKDGKKADNVENVPGGERRNPRGERPVPRTEQQNKVSGEPAEDRREHMRRKRAGKKRVAERQQRHEQAFGDPAQHKPFFRGECKQLQADGNGVRAQSGDVQRDFPPIIVIVFSIA